MTVQQFRKKPVEIDAIHYDGSEDRTTKIIDWILANGGTARWYEADFFRGEDEEPMPEHICIDTLNGTVRVSIGEWIIRGVKGEFYPCADDIFQETYDTVFDDAATQKLFPLVENVNLGLPTQEKFFSNIIGAVTYDEKNHRGIFTINDETWQGYMNAIEPTEMAIVVRGSTHDNTYVK